MRKLIIILLALSFTVASVSAEFTKVGSSGAQFLKIAVGSKYQAMGEASVAVANDVYAMYWNPAGLSQIENSAVSFTRVDYLLDVNLNYLGYAHYVDNVGVFGFSATVLTMNDLEITTFEDQDGTGEFYSTASYALGLTYARQFNARFSFGLTAKYIGEKIHNENATGFAFDFGTLLYTGYNSLRMGMSISNMGPEMSFSGSDLIVNYDDRNGNGSNAPVGAELKTTPFNLPMVFRVGMAYDVDISDKNTLMLAGEFKHPNDFEQQASFGAQFNFDQKFFLRSGYKFNYDEEGLTIGGGLSTAISSDSRLLIDYAWQDFGRMESTQRFTVGFVF